MPEMVDRSSVMPLEPPRVLAIVNPAAGGEPEALVASLKVAIRDSLEVGYTRGRGDARRLAAEYASASRNSQHDSVVVSIGGDGTAREVADGLYRTASAQPGGKQPAMLIAPGGTGNSNYRSIWNDRAWTDVLATLAAGSPPVRAIDLAMTGSGDIVLLGAAAGVIAEALVHAKQSRSTGRRKLAEAMFRTLAEYKPIDCRVAVDGRVLIDAEIMIVNIGGGRFRGGGFDLLPGSVLDDGLLDVCVATTEATSDDLVKLAATGGLAEHPAVRYGRGRQVTVERTDGQPLLYEHDGDLMPAERSGFTVTVLPEALRIVDPSTRIVDPSTP
jgi:diacylglycerol kinase (ATP)